MILKPKLELYIRLYITLWFKDYMTLVLLLPFFLIYISISVQLFIYKKI